MRDLLTVKTTVLEVRGLKKKAAFIQVNVDAQQKYTREDTKKTREWGDEFDL